MARRRYCGVPRPYCAKYDSIRLVAGAEGARSQLRRFDSTVYKILNTPVDEKPEATCKYLKKLVGASGFEPPTSWSRRLVARKINKLHGMRLITTECYNRNVQLEVPENRRYSVALSRVRWWAQNWAQSQPRREP